MARYYEQDGTWIEGEPTTKAMLDWFGNRAFRIYFAVPRSGQAVAIAARFRKGDQVNPAGQALMRGSSLPVRGRIVHLDAKDLRDFEASEQEIARNGKRK